MMSNAWCCHDVGASNLGWHWGLQRSGHHDVVQVEELLAMIQEIHCHGWTGEVATSVCGARENRPVNVNVHARLEGVVLTEPWWLRNKRSEDKNHKPHKKGKEKENSKTEATKSRPAICKQRRQFFTGVIKILVPRFGFNWACDTSFFVCTFEKGPPHLT